MMEVDINGVDHRKPRRLNDIIKSPADKRSYRTLELANRLKVVLVSDPKTDKSAAALNVMVGSMSDPENLPGLAHYLEHMLFLGTEKYPLENEYAKYLSENAGSSNAYTAGDCTCYYFDISPESLEGALDRFCQFFISPLFTESGSEREVLAVQSEHEGNVTDDDARKNRVDSFLSIKSHPYCRFKTGNKQTLWTGPRENSIDVRTELIKFHKAYYSSNIMNLAIFGKESLDELEEMAIRYFSSIVDLNVEVPKWCDSPYGPEELQTCIDILPIMDIRELDLVFPIPDYTQFYKSGASSYLKSLIGNEGPGSLLSLLKKKYWVTDLSVWSECPAFGFAFFGIDITLTPSGLKKINEIITHVFQYIEMLRSTDPQKWFWEEIKIVRETSFRFKEEELADSLVVDLVDQMMHYPVEDVFMARYSLSDYRPDLIENLLKCLVPENVRIITSTKANKKKVTEKEEFYGAKYCYSKINSSTIESWKTCGLNKELTLPPPNKFLPSLFDLKPRDRDTGIFPRIIFDNELSRVWYMQDNEFLFPRAIVIVDILFPYSKFCPKNYNLQALLENVIDDLLTEYTYSASKAGLHYSLSSSLSGFRLQVSGYDHKIATFFLYILKFLINFSSVAQNLLELQRFEDTREAYIRNLQNYEDEDPSTHAADFLTQLLSSHAFSNDELLGAIDDLTYENLVAYSKLIFSAVRLQWLIVGNVTEEESLALHEDSLQCFQHSRPLLSSQLSPSRELSLNTGCNYLYRAEHKSHTNSCVHFFLQYDLGDLRETVVLKLIDHILTEPCFDILRTKEQLGYYTDCATRKSRGVLGFQVIIQGDKHPHYLESRIENFLQEMSTTINNLTLEEFTKYKSSLRVVRSEKPKTLRARCAQIDAEILRRTYNFDKQNLELIELDKLTMAELKSFFKKWISPKSVGRKLLAVHVVSVAEGGVGHIIDEEDIIKGRELVHDISHWKNSLGYYPAPKAWNGVPPWKNHSPIKAQA